LSRTTPRATLRCVHFDGSPPRGVIRLRGDGSPPITPAGVNGYLTPGKPECSGGGGEEERASDIDHAAAEALRRAKRARRVHRRPRLFDAVRRVFRRSGRFERPRLTTESLARAHAFISYRRRGGRGIRRAQRQFYTGNESRLHKFHRNFDRWPTSWQTDGNKSMLGPMAAN